MTLLEHKRSSASQSALKVLVVEDNPSDAALVEAMLESSRFAVSTVPSIARATAAVATERPDCVLLDLGLPDADGIEALDKISAAIPGVPVVVLTGRSDSETGLVAMQRGAQDYVSKDSVNEDILVRTLRYAVERKAATDALAESNERFRAAFNGAPIGEACVSPTGVFLEVNAEMCRMTGLSADELIGKSVADVAHPDDREVVRAQLEEASTRPGPAKYQRRYLRPDGSVVHALVTAAPVRTASGEMYLIGLIEDVTEKRRADEQLRVQARLLDSVGQAVVAVDMAARITYWNRAAEEMFGWTAAEAIGRSVLDVAPAMAFTDRAREILEQTKSGGSWSGEFVGAHRDGTAFPGLAVSRPVFDDDANVIGTIGVASDLTELKNAEERLRQSEERFRSLVQNTADVITVHDAHGRITYASPSFVDVYGIEPEVAVGNKTSERINDDDARRLYQDVASLAPGQTHRAEMRVRHADGRWIHVESEIVNMLDHPAIGGYVATTRDISERKQFEAELEYRATHDDLTPLVNRSHFIELVSRRLASEPRSGAVLLIDVDSFKLINESLGYAAGDEVLRAVARRLSVAAGASGVVARIGGDDFAAFVPASDIRSAEREARRLLSLFDAPVFVDGRRVLVSATIGLAHAGDPVVDDADELLRNADAAVRRAKQQRSAIFVYDDSLREKARRRLSLEGALREAVKGDGLRVLYQPQIRLKTGGIAGAEALVRWFDEERGMIPPGEFIDIAEDTNLIGAIGDFVLADACRTARQWRREHPERKLTVSVNLSARQLSDPGLVASIQRRLDESRVDPAAICFEVTESAVMEDAAASEATLRAIKALGVKIAIDDFGTGYSSLAYLKRFPVDYLKIDRSFVSGLGRTSEDHVIVRTIIDLARSLAVDVVAEGVEEIGQGRELVKLGCGLAQGYLWSRPVPKDEITPILDRGFAAVEASRGSVHALETEITDVVDLLAHELRNPMTVIRGYAETLAAADTTAEVRRIATGAITSNVARVDSLLRLLGDVQSIETGRIRLKRAPTDIAILAADAVEEARMLRPQTAIEVELRSAASPIVDAHRIREVLANLLDNAGKYSPAQSSVRLVVDCDDREAQISVIDCGPGVPEEHVGDIFRKFYRLDYKGPGTGLGLFLGRQIARAHGGELSYRRAETGGAEFVLTLPREVG